MSRPAVEAGRRCAPRRSRGRRSRPRRRRSSTGPAGPGSSSPRTASPSGRPSLKKVYSCSMPNSGSWSANFSATSAQRGAGVGGVRGHGLGQQHLAQHEDVVAAADRVRAGEDRLAARSPSCRPAPGWCDEPSKPQMPGSAPSARIFVLDRISGVGSVPSIQMYSARYATCGHPSFSSWSRTGGAVLGPYVLTAPAGPTSRHRAEPCWSGFSVPLPQCERSVNWAALAGTGRHPAGTNRGCSRRPERPTGDDPRPGWPAGAPDVKMESSWTTSRTTCCARVEERRVRLVRLWFTDVLGPAQVGRHLPGRARGGLRGGRAVRRLRHRRLQPRPGERRARLPRPQLASSSCRAPTART